MSYRIPLASHEVRWFLNGESKAHSKLREWFEQSAPFARDPGVAPPAWKGRQDDEPDVYLIVPGADNVGIKWREGELQIKGRAVDMGAKHFGQRHAGHVEQWIKWSFAELPDSYREMFAGNKGGVIRIPVRKTRALRKIRLDTMTGKAQEVDAKTMIDRGISVELTDLIIDGIAYCSLACEAFPDDSGMHDAFSRSVGVFLDSAPRDFGIQTSFSYPEWLRTLARN